MRAEKIVQIKCHDSEHSGPARETTLGFKIGDRTVLLGSFYEGYGCEAESLEEKPIVEALIDEIVAAVNANVKDGE